MILLLILLRFLGGMIAILIHLNFSTALTFMDTLKKKKDIIKILSITLFQKLLILNIYSILLLTSILTTLSSFYIWIFYLKGHSFINLNFNWNYIYYKKYIATYIRFYVIEISFFCLKLSVLYYRIFVFFILFSILCKLGYIISYLFIPTANCIGLMDGIDLDEVEQFDTTDYEKLMSFNRSTMPEMYLNHKVVRLNTLNHHFDLFHLFRFEPFPKQLSNNIYGSYHHIPNEFMFFYSKKVSIFHSLLLNITEMKFQSRCQFLDVHTKQLHIFNIEDNIISERYNTTRELVYSNTLENPYNELLRSQRIHRALESTAEALTDSNRSYNLLINERYRLMCARDQTEAEIHYWRQRLGLREYLFSTQPEQIAEKAWQAIELSIMKGEKFDGSQWANKNAAQCRNILLTDLCRLDKLFKRCTDIAYDIIQEK